MALGDGILDLGAVGEVGGTDLDLGATGAAARQLSIGATTARPTAAIRTVKVRLVEIGATTARPTAAIQAVKLRLVAVGATTGKARCVAALAYDPNLLSDVVGPSTQTWDSALLRGASPQIQISPAALLGRALPGAWSPADRQTREGPSNWAPAQRAILGVLGRWALGGSQRYSSGDAWSPGTYLDALGAEAWREGDREAHAGGAQWHPHPPRWADQAGDAGGGTQSWRDGDRAGHGIPLGGLRDGPFMPSQSLPKWNDGALMPYVRRIPPPPLPPPPWERDWDNNLCLRLPLTYGYLDLGILPCPLIEPPGPGTTIPRRRTYFVLHDIALYRLSDSLPIDCESLTITLDADAWAWSWSGRLLGRAALDAVLPTLDGEPVTLVADIDGYLWHLVVEDWSEEREFGRRGISASGRGLTAWLAAPYQLPASGVLANARTIQQAMGELLPLDWTLTWQTDAPDWTLPAGAWSWQRTTPIQAIHAAAQEVGAIVVPAMATRTLHVQPRYPVLPWDFAAADPDLVVPDAAILSISRQRRVETQANAVYVHGGEVGGILARVYRAQSAGDRLAETQSSTLITHADGARQLGSRILAANERQPEVRSIRLPVGGDFTLGALGQLLEIEDGSEDVRGIINGVQVEVAGGAKATVRQTLTIGEEAPNIWARFRSLLPADPLLAGEVTIVHGDGTVTVALIGGGTIRVRGEATEGDMVYVRGQRIDGAAPELTGIEIDV